MRAAEVVASDHVEEVVPGEQDPSVITGHRFMCPVDQVGGDACGPFASQGWPTHELAVKRLQDHIDEHLEGAAATAEGRDVDRSKVSLSLEEFRARHGIAVTDDGQAVLAEEQQA